MSGFEPFYYDEHGEIQAGKAPTRSIQSTLGFSAGGEGLVLQPPAAPRHRRRLGVRPPRPPTVTVDLTNLDDMPHMAAWVPPPMPTSAEFSKWLSSGGDLSSSSTWEDDSNTFSSMVPGSLLTGKRHRPEIGSDKFYSGPSVSGQQFSLLSPDFYGLSTSTTHLNLEEDSLVPLMPKNVYGSSPRGIKKRERESSEDHEFLMPSNDEGGSTHIHSSSDENLLDLSSLKPLSLLPQGWFEGTVGINTGENLWGSVDYQMLCRGPTTREFYGAGAGHWLLAPLAKPLQEIGESDFDMKKKWDIYAGKVVRSREHITSFFEHLLAGLVPPTFEIPLQPSPAPGSFEAFLAASSSDASCVASAHQIDFGGYGKTPQNEISMGPMKRVQELASKSMKKIKALNPSAPKVPSTAVGMVGGAGRNINASLLLAKKRRENPEAIVFAAEVDMTGGAGQNLDAGNLLREIRRHDPEAIVFAEDVDMTGCAGQSIDAGNLLREFRRENPHANVSAEEIRMPGAAGQKMDAAWKLRNDYCLELVKRGTVFEIKQHGMEQQGNVAPEKTLKFLYSQYAPDDDGRWNSFEAFQKAVKSPKKWHRFPDGSFMAHPPNAVVLNDSSSPKNAFAALDSLGLPAAPAPSGGRPRGNCPLCGKEMRLDSIKGHKSSKMCVLRRQKNLKND